MHTTNFVGPSFAKFRVKQIIKIFFLAEVILRQMF